jgi:hypothetical protein
MSRFSSRLFGTTPVSQWLKGRGGGIKSVQRGTISIAGASSNTATISAVDVTNSVLSWGGSFDAAGTQFALGCARVALTNATTVTATRASSDVAATTVHYEVVEYFPGTIKNVQRGTITNDSATKDATITAVDVNKASATYLGFSVNLGGMDTTQLTRLTLLDGTTVRVVTGTANSQVTGYQVVEFF